MTNTIQNSKSKKIRELFIINDNVSTNLTESKNVSYNNKIYFNDKLTNKLSNIISDIIYNKIQDISLKQDDRKFNLRIENKNYKSLIRSNDSLIKEYKPTKSKIHENFSFPSFFSIFN